MEEKPKPNPESAKAVSQEVSTAAKKSSPKNTSVNPEVKVAAILIRNITGAGPTLRATLKMLRLHIKNTCIVLDNNKINMGMLSKAKDYIAYGEISAEVIKLLEDNRGNNDIDGNIKKHFHLHPPRGGFERKGIKHSFTQGGALGYRGSNMNKLIKKMI